MYKYIFLYAAVAFLVLLLFHTEDSMTKYAMAQEEQSSNQTQIVVAQT
jgi:hypothetical protein